MGLRRDCSDFQIRSALRWSLNWVILIMKIAILMPTWLGDLAMATPTIRAIRRHFGAPSQLVGVMRPYQSSLLEGTGWLDEQWNFDPRSKDAKLRLTATALRMRRARFDMAVLLPNSFRTALLAYLGGVRQRVGYTQYGRGPLLTTKIRAKFYNGGQWTPQVDRYLGIAGAIGCPVESRRLELKTTSTDERSADEVFRRLGIRDNGRLVLLNSSSASSPSRLWPVKHFGELARTIAGGLDQDVLVMCGPQERDMARAIAQLSGHPRVFSMADQPLDLGTAKACMRRGKLMISTDSGPRHVAAALGVQGITLFGPIHPGITRNPEQRAVELHLDLDCLGCKKRICPLKHHRCMRDLSVDTVYAEAEKLLTADRRQPVVHQIAHHDTFMTPIVS